LYSIVYGTHTVAFGTHKCRTKRTHKFGAAPNERACVTENSGSSTILKRFARFSSV